MVFIPAMRFSLILLLTLLAAHAVMADDIGLRLRFGLNDKEATDWSGTVTVAPGEVTQISGWRFAQTDKADGTAGWSCRTRPVAANLRRSNNPEKQAARKAGAAMRLPMGDNGVLLAFTGVTEDSRVTIKTPQGEFTFAFADVPCGKLVMQLADAVEIERTAAAQPFTSDAKTDEDYPSGASLATERYGPHGRAIRRGSIAGCGRAASIRSRRN